MTDVSTAPGSAAETRPFGAEVSRLLHLMAHSVYSNREIFLRELISNAADACEKLRMVALERPELLADDPELRVTLAGDPAAATLTVEDNGIGMGREELADNLGTIARSGTRAFLDKAGSGGTALIGQFGIGFYSAFMVADRVEVLSRAAGEGAAFVWESDGHGQFTIGEAPTGQAPRRGTRIVLHLNAESKEFAEDATIERVVTAHSSHVAVPIRLRLKDGAAEKTLSDGSALWRKPKGSVTAEETAAFYRELTGDFADPALTLHFRAEGRQEYAALLFVPAEKPFDLFDPDRKGRVKLYVRRVFITSEASILPPWLRFVRGVIDSEDLPLNISREMLQTDPNLKAIGKAVTTRLLTEMERLAKDDPEKFAQMCASFGAVIKEGLYEEPERRDALFKIARFRSTRSGDSGEEAWRSLDDYIAGLRPNQTAIYYALGESPAAILASPHLEGFASRGVEVLLLSDPVDAFWVRTALGYQGKPFQSVTQGGADLSLIPQVEGAAEPPAPAADAAGSVAALAVRLKDLLAAEVEEVRVSNRLTGSPVCLVATERGPDRHLEKLLARQGGGTRRAPILEINPGHDLIQALARRAAANADDPTLPDAARVLLGQAAILDGEPPSQPAEFAASLDRLLLARLN